MGKKFLGGLFSGTGVMRSRWEKKKKKKRTYKYINIKMRTQQECAAMFHVSRRSSLSSPRAEFSRRQLCAAISSPRFITPPAKMSNGFLAFLSQNIYERLQKWWHIPTNNGSEGDPAQKEKKHRLWYTPSPVILRWMGSWHIKWMWAPVFITSRPPVMILNCTKPRRKSSR